MKHLPLLLAAALAALCPLAAQQPAEAKREPVKLSLVSGDSITGTVSGVKGGELSLITDYGVIRVPVAKLTEDSRKKLGISADANVAQLEKRVAELEALVERLRAENAQLRRQPLPTPTPTQVQPLTGGGTNKVTPSQPAQAGGYWISSTGKRHNARCRFYATSKGRSGSASDGVACKVCGG
ncbi:bZIP transcription factor [Luteolibacter sp. GHJ8]|uniref:BZIP transcription factor n=1 Tax=Luteolibacter rhizosphaerae TaxID=2989719 RepID=A0ABT3FZN0_9BACT|nr:bZIP transcription factor [Luteolibacter rhizosphaerae]MCW1913032.1 bZIP transcription factor [Luteolibacter rhizosphaerae]